MAIKPRIAKTEELKPLDVSTEGTRQNPQAKPRVAKTEEMKPNKPTAEK